MNIIAFILILVLWPIVYGLTKIVLTVLLMGIFNCIPKPVQFIADIFLFIVCAASQFSSILMAIGICLLFGLEVTFWMILPCILWISPGIIASFETDYEKMDNIERECGMLLPNGNTFADTKAHIDWSTHCGNLAASITGLLVFVQ
jgi:hypothetical protein